MSKIDSNKLKRIGMDKKPLKIDHKDPKFEVGLFKSELSMLLKKWDVEISIVQDSMYSPPGIEGYLNYWLFELPSHLSFETLIGSAGQNNGE